MKLTLRNNKLIFLDKSLEINDLYTEKFYSISDKFSDEYKENFYIINELFLRYIQKYRLIELFFLENNIKEIVIEGENLDKHIFLDVSKKNNMKINLKNKFSFLNLILKKEVYLNLSFLYFFFKILKYPYNNKKVKNKEFSVIRSSASKSKMNFLENKIDIKYEMLGKKNSIYSHFKKKQRFRFIVNSYKKSRKELEIYINYIKKSVGVYSSSDVISYYGKRILHMFLYEEMLDVYFRENKDGIFYTGNNLDRFALIEEKLAKKYNIKLICIPHGIEYGFKFPHCFVGDLFYCTSKYSSFYLNNLYNTKKFIYDSEILKEMFRIKKEIKPNLAKKIIFFTESRDIDINLKIVDEVLNYIEKYNLKLFLKLHPKDNYNNYNNYKNRIFFIEKLEEALNNNICFARKSTTLLEALNNGSKVAAVLINNKDLNMYNIFPSLKDERIKKCVSIKELGNWLINEKLKK